MPDALEKIYSSHHAARRGAGFVLLGAERGRFLAEAVGNGKRVLDIGCRDGALTKFFAEGNRVVGLDIDAEALERARRSLGIETKHADLNGEWGVEPHSFDAVVAAEVLEHLYYPDVVIGKVVAVLKQGGVFAGTVPNAFSLIHRLRYLRMRKEHTPLGDPTHINHFTLVELHGLLAERFADVEVVGYGRLGWLARKFPQTFAFGLAWRAARPISGSAVLA